MSNIHHPFYYNDKFVIIFCLLLLSSCKNGLSQSFTAFDANRTLPLLSSPTSFASSFNSNRTSSPQFQLPTTLPISESQPLSKSNAIEYFQSLFQKAIPLNLNREQTKIFLIAPTNNTTNDSNVPLSASNDNILFEGIGQPIERKKSYYFLIPNEQITGRSVTGGDQSAAPQIVSDKIAHNYQLDTLDNSLSQNFTGTELNSNRNFSLLTEESRTSGNDSHPISNPFASAPYRSSNDVIESLIQNIFSDLTLQSLPPEEVLFGKLPEPDPQKQLDPAIIFGNRTEPEQQPPIEFNQPRQVEPESQFQTQPSPQLPLQPASQFHPQPETQLQPQPVPQFQTQPSSQLPLQPAYQFNQQPATQLQPQPAPQFQTQSPSPPPPQLQKVDFRQPPTTPILTNYSLGNLDINNRSLNNTLTANQRGFISNNDIFNNNYTLNQGYNRNFKPNQGNYTFDRENFTFVRNVNNLPSLQQHNGFTSNFTLNNNYNLTNSNNYKSFEPVRHATVSFNLSSFQFPPIPPRYQAGVEYSETDEMPNVTDQDLFVELNRIQEPSVSVTKPEPISRFSTTDVPRTIPTTFNDEIKATTLPIDYDQLQNNQQQQQQQLVTGKIQAQTFFPSTPIPRGQTVQFHSQRVTHVAPASHSKEISNGNLAYQKLNISRYNNYFNNNYYAPYENTNFPIYNSPTVSGSTNEYYKYNISGNNFVKTYPTTLQHRSSISTMQTNRPLTTTLVPNPFLNKQQSTQQQSTGSLTTYRYSSISQRSKSRPTMGINPTTTKPEPPSLRTVAVPMVMIPTEIADRLVNIISLPNYKFYLGKKTG